MPQKDTVIILSGCLYSVKLSVHISQAPVVRQLDFHHESLLNLCRGPDSSKTRRISLQIKIFWLMQKNVSHLSNTWIFAALCQITF